MYNLENDPFESQNLAAEDPILFEQMKKEFIQWNETVELSRKGKDYKDGKVLKNPESHFWMEDERYHPYFEEWLKRPEYRHRILKGS